MGVPGTEFEAEWDLDRAGRNPKKSLESHLCDGDAGVVVLGVEVGSWMAVGEEAGLMVLPLLAWAESVDEGVEDWLALFADRSSKAAFFSYSRY